MGAPSHSHKERLAPGLRIGSYVIEKSLGSGGMGSVWAARHVGLDKPVAIKTLHSTLASNSEQVKRFVREGRAASRIRHPHVVDVTDVGTWEGLPYLVMELLEGEDVHTRLDACGRLTPAEIARIMLPVLDALAFAHDASVIHRDLKPSNIFLARGPHGEVPMLLDFGIAKILDTDHPDAQTITIAANYLGTPYYSSPEQAMSGSSADARSDQYSVGAIMYELVSGQTGLEGDTPFEVLSAIVAKQRKPLETLMQVEPALAAIINRTMSYYPDGRYPTIRHVGNALLPLAPPAVRARWASHFAVSEEAAGVAFAETMNSIGESVEPAPASASAPVSVSAPVSASAPAPEPSGPYQTPSFTPPAAAPGPTSVSGISRIAPASHGGTPRFSQPAPSQPGMSQPGMSQPGMSQPGTSQPGLPVAAPEPASGGSGFKLVLAALAGLVVAASAAAGLWYARGSFVTGPEEVEVTFRALPPEAQAQFTLDGVPLEGVGEANATLESNGERHELTVSAEGYAPATISFDADSPPEPIALEPLPEDSTEPTGDDTGAAPEGTEPRGEDETADTEPAPETSPEETAPEETAPEETAPEETAPEAAAPEETAPDEDTGSDGAAPWWDRRTGRAGDTARDSRRAQSTPRAHAPRRSPTPRPTPQAPVYTPRPQPSPRTSTVTRGTNGAPVAD